MSQATMNEETTQQRSERILNQLKAKYPEAYAFDLDGRALHFVCEVEPTTEHPEYDRAVEVMIKTLPHTSKLDLTLTDLDNNGSDEYILMPWEICGISMRGASGNGDILIIRDFEDQYKIIGLIPAANGFTVLKEELNGYKNIMVNSHSSAATGSESIYSYQTFSNGEEIPGQYEVMLTKYYDLSR